RAAREILMGQFSGGATRPCGPPAEATSDTGWRGWLRDLLRGYADLILAPVCLGCGSSIPTGAAERLVCGPCRTRLRELPHPRCPRCATPRPPAISPHLVRTGCTVCD